MLSRNHPGRIRIAFDDTRLVANTELLLPVTLAQHLVCVNSSTATLTSEMRRGGANTGDKMLTLVASALAGGDCIDDADVLRTGGTTGAIGCAVKAPSTLGTFLRSFRWGHVRQPDRVRAWRPRLCTAGPARLCVHMSYRGPPPQTGRCPPAGPAPASCPP